MAIRRSAQALPRWLIAGAAALVLAGCAKSVQDQSADRRAAEASAYFAGNITEERLLHIEEEPQSWLTGGRDYQQSYFSPLKQIDRTNVGELGFAWRYDIDTDDGFEATPIVVDGVMYSSGPKGAVYALDAKTGAEIWTFTPQIDPDIVRKVCCGIVSRGLAVWKGRVFVGSLDGFLYALDAADGETLWKVNTIIDTARGYTVTGAPYIAGDVVVIGNSGAELDARGYVTAYDTQSGEQKWRFFIVPASAEGPFEHEELAMAAKTWDPNSLWEVGLGGTVWDGMAYDPELKLLYVGTGNAAPYPRKLRSPAGGDNLFLASILAIDAQNGRLVWHYQTTPADNWDFTATQKMILADMDFGGAQRKVIMQAPKNGFFYVLDRETGELLSAKPYVPVNWASHVDMETGRPVETGQGEYFDEPKLVFPSPAGGHNWHPMAYNPVTGLVYIPAQEAGAFWQMPEEPFQYVKGSFNTASIYSFPAPGSWGFDSEEAKTLPPVENLYRGQPDATMRGFLRAWDPVKGEVAWEVETSDIWAGEMFAIGNGGGAMTSAGGLVFQGRATGDLVVFDARDGKELAKLDVGTSIMAAPMTYSIDGEQYVAVMAGLGGALGQLRLPGTAAYEYGNGGRILAFKLGGGPTPKPAPVDHGADDGFPMPPVPRPNDTAQIEVGAGLFEKNCRKCHVFTDDNGSGIPDLRKMSAATHEEFNDILLRGTRADRGMGDFSSILSLEDVEALHAYLIDLAWRSYDKSEGVSKPHQPEAVTPN